MLYICLPVFIGLFLPAFFGRKKGNLIERAVEGWEEIFLRLRGLAKVRAPTASLKRKRMDYRKSQALRELYPLGHPEEEKRRFEREKHRYIFLVCVAASFFALLSAVDELTAGEPEGYAIQRNPPGGTGKSLLLEARTEDGEVFSEVSIEVEPRRYTDKELESLYTAMLPVLEDTVLNGNPDVGHVSGDLYLPATLQGFPFHLKWRSGNYDLMEDTGRLTKEEFAPEGEALSLYVTALCQEFEREYSFPVILVNRPLDEKQQEYRRLLGAVEESIGSSPEEERAYLPESFEDKALSWIRPESGGALMILAFGMLLALLTGAARENHLSERVKERDRRLIYAYPDFVNRLNLYMGAGMSISSCLIRIAGEGNGEEEDYLHQELKYTVNELSGGVSEKDALEGLGKRCRLSPYIKLTTLLVQNLRKGGTQLLPRLREEAENAFSMRKNLAREAGERAGTKLIFPMLLMMGVVMVVIIVPAFTGFSE